MYVVPHGLCICGSGHCIAQAELLKDVKVGLPIGVEPLDPDPAIPKPFLEFSF